MEQPSRSLPKASSPSPSPSPSPSSPVSMIRTGRTTRRRWITTVSISFSLSLSLWSVLSLIVWSSLPNGSFRFANAAQARRRVTFRRDGVAYDREITTFTEDGRLAQVEYGLEASLRGSTVGAMRVMMIPKAGVGASDGASDESNQDDGNDGQQPAFPSSSVPMSSCILVCIEHSSFGKMHRIDDHLWMITAGLSGDARMLANMARRSCQNHRLRYGEAPSVGQAARITADFHHRLTRMGGCRPMGCTALLLGIDPLTGVARLVRTDPGGGCEECGSCAAGRSRDAVARELAGLVEELGDGSPAKDRGTASGGTTKPLWWNGGGTIGRAAVEMASRFLRLLDKGGSGKNGGSTTSPSVDVWTIEPKPGHRGGMLATCYSGVRLDTVEKILRIGRGQQEQEKQEQAP